METSKTVRSLGLGNSMLATLPPSSSAMSVMWGCKGDEWRGKGVIVQMMATVVTCALHEINAKHKNVSIQHTASADFMRLGLEHFDC